MAPKQDLSGPQVLSADEIRRGNALLKQAMKYTPIHRRSGALDNPSVIKSPVPSRINARSRAPVEPGGNTIDAREPSEHDPGSSSSQESLTVEQRLRLARKARQQIASNIASSLGFHESREACQGSESVRGGIEDSEEMNPRDTAQALESREIQLRHFGETRNNTGSFQQSLHISPKRRRGSADYDSDLENPHFNVEARDNSQNATNASERLSPKKQRRSMRSGSNIETRNVSLYDLMCRRASKVLQTYGKNRAKLLKDLEHQRNKSRRPRRLPISELVTASEKASSSGSEDNGDQPIELSQDPISQLSDNEESAAGNSAGQRHAIRLSIKVRPRRGLGVIDTSEFRMPKSRCSPESAIHVPQRPSYSDGFDGNEAIATGRVMPVKRTICRQLFVKFNVRIGQLKIGPEKLPERPPETLEQHREQKLKPREITSPAPVHNELRVASHEDLIVIHDQVVAVPEVQTVSRETPMLTMEDNKICAVHADSNSPLNNKQVECRTVAEDVVVQKVLSDDPEYDSIKTQKPVFVRNRRPSKRMPQQLKTMPIKRLRQGIRSKSVMAWQEMSMVTAPRRLGDEGRSGSDTNHESTDSEESDGSFESAEEGSGIPEVAIRVPVGDEDNDMPHGDEETERQLSSEKEIVEDSEEGLTGYGKGILQDGEGPKEHSDEPNDDHSERQKEEHDASHLATEYSPSNALYLSYVAFRISSPHTKETPGGKPHKLPQPAAVEEQLSIESSFSPTTAKQLSSMHSDDHDSWRPRVPESQNSALLLDKDIIDSSSPLSALRTVESRQQSRQRISNRPTTTARSRSEIYALETMSQLSLDSHHTQLSTVLGGTQNMVYHANSSSFLPADSHHTQASTILGESPVTGITQMTANGASQTTTMLGLPENRVRRAFSIFSPQILPDSEIQETQYIVADQQSYFERSSQALSVPDMLAQSHSIARRSIPARVHFVDQAEASLGPGGVSMSNAFQSAISPVRTPGQRISPTKAAKHEKSLLQLTRQASGEMGTLPASARKRMQSIPSLLSRPASRVSYN